MSGQIETKFGLRWPLASKDGRSNLVRAFKATGCAVCGVRYPEVDWSDLHVDHIDPADKPNTSSLRSMGGMNPGSGNGVHRSSVEIILAELLKCQVLCSKHHLGSEGKHGRNGNGQSDVSAEQLALFVPDPEYRTGPWRST